MLSDTEWARNRCRLFPAESTRRGCIFEAPPSSRVTSEMNRFLEWFARTRRDGQQPLSALTRAAVAQLYFESIHPFKDGNGRIGRAIAEKSLAESLGQPTLITLAATILLRRKSYYEALEAANKQNEITNWLAWFAGIAIEAPRRTIALAEFLIDKTKQLDRLKGELNERQTKALLRMFREGPCRKVHRDYRRISRNYDTRSVGPRLERRVDQGRRTAARPVSPKRPA